MCPSCGLKNHLDAGAVDSPVRCFGCNKLVSRLDPGATCVKLKADFIEDAQLHRASRGEPKAQWTPKKVAPNGKKELPALTLPRALHV
jgi:hypothetical protein